MSMTDDDKTLVERLKDEWPYMFIGDDEWLDTDALDGQRTQAADRIEALSAEKEAARMEERAAIVAWLRETADIFHDEIRASKKRDTSELLHHAQSCSRAAKAIEEGEHLK